MRVSYAVVFVSDMRRSVAFYRDVVGLPLRFETPGFTEFATEGATLALHAGEGHDTVTADPHKEPAGRCRPGFSVTNLDDFHKRMVDHRVRCIQQPQHRFGVRLAEYADPDGMAFSVGEDRATG